MIGYCPQQISQNCVFNLKSTSVYLSKPTLQGAFKKGKLCTMPSQGSQNVQSLWPILLSKYVDIWHELHNYEGLRIWQLRPLIISCLRKIATSCRRQAKPSNRCAQSDHILRLGLRPGGLHRTYGQSILQCRGQTYLRVRCQPARSIRYVTRTLLLQAVVVVRISASVPPQPSMRAR
jgi:hypothetical protein